MALTYRPRRTTQPRRRTRRHDRPVCPESDCRAELERDGWRTTLAFHENVVRDDDGQLTAAEPCWVAEAEWYGERTWYAHAAGATAAEAWWALLDAIEQLVAGGQPAQRCAG